MATPLRSLAGSAVLAGLALAAPAQAQPGAWSLEAGLAPRFERFDEHDRNGNRLVREEGWGLEAAIGARRLWGSTGLELGAAIGASSLDYAGRLQSGPAFNTDTDVRWLRLRAGLLQALSPQWQAVAAVEFGERQRNIRGRSGVSGLDERYRHTSLALGLAWQDATSRLPGRWRLEWLYAPNPTVKVDFLGNYDGAQISQGNRQALRLAADLPLPPRGGLSLSLAPMVEWSRTRQGDTAGLTRNGSTVGSVSQPRITQHIIGLGLLARW